LAGKGVIGAGAGHPGRFSLRPPRPAHRPL